MSGRKDQRNADLVVPYVHQKPKGPPELTAIISSSLPMVAMFTRIMSWSSLFTAIQSYLSEPRGYDNSSSSAQPAWVRVTFALISVIVSYMDSSPSFQAAKAAAAKSAAAAASATAEAIL